MDKFLVAEDVWILIYKMDETMACNLRMKKSDTRKSPVNFNSPAGFTLVEVLVAIAIAFVGIGIFAVSLFSSYTSRSSIQTVATRDDLGLQLRHLISDRRSLKKTIELNPFMLAVAKNDYSVVGNVYNDTVYGVYLYNSAGDKISGRFADSSNPTADPVYYTIDGVPCAGPATNCPFSVTAFFKIQGMPKDDTGTPHLVYPVPGKPYWRPDFMIISYKIEYVDTTGSTLNRKPLTGSVFVDLLDLGMKWP